MELLFKTPFIIRIIVTLVIFLVVNKISNNLILSIILGTIVIAFWSGHSISNIILISWERLSSLDNILLVIVVLQVIFLSSQMKESGIMDDLVKYIKQRVPKKISIAIMPAIIGLLPMPGGALFSAPMVDDIDHDKSVDNDLKTKINYWFRHVWEFWWPLYPGVLLAISITGLPVWQFIILQVPLSLFHLTAGWFFLLRKMKVENDKKSVETDNLNFFFLILPIFTVVILYMLIKIFIPYVGNINKYLPMVIALVFSQAVLQFMRPIKKFYKILLSLRAIKLAVIVALIRIYGAFIEAKLPDGNLIMDKVREELFYIKIPVIIIIMILPFISGISTGIAIGFVGASFPIVVNLIGNNIPLNIFLSYVVIAYSFGYIGMILSPVHVCFLVTNQYFKTNIIKNIFGLLYPSLIVISGGIIIHIIYRFII